MNRSPTSIALALSLFLCGCGRVYDYPEGVDERGTDVCRDELDNDFDGHVDCNDPSCEGFCPEETLTECIDGRDNDGDGLGDAANPLCWLHSAPVTKRCAQAEGADIVDHFDMAPSVVDPAFLPPSWGNAWRWANWGYDGDEPIVQFRPHANGGRQDLLTAFSGNAASAPVLGSNLASVVERDPFSGSWVDFELAFSASVPEGSLLRIGVVPVEFAPSSTTPRAGAESALVSLTLDATKPVARLTFDVEGRIFEAELEHPIACEQSSCPEPMARINVVRDTDGLLATITHPGGDVTALRADPPSSLSLQPARLVFWGGSPTGEPGPEFDDLRASIRPELPCGFRAPQIPTDACGHIDFRAYGQSLSVAPGPGGHCALVGVSRWDQSLWDGGGQLVSPDRITAWNSEDGEAWARTSVIEPLEEGLNLVGTGITSADDRYYAVALYRDDRPSQEDGDGGASGAGGADAEGEGDRATRLAFLSGDGCDDWGSLQAGPSLFADAEAPSYVIRDEHEIYFTRPPNAGSRRTLWRLIRDDPDSVELVAELPPGVGQPVTVGLVGDKDLVLTYPTSADAGGKGVGLLVADAEAKVWHKVGDTPVLAVPPGPDLPAGTGRLGFDDDEVLAAALSWQRGEGFLLYSGRSFGGWPGADNSTPVLAVGTARIAAAGHTFDAPARVREKSCGDGTCDVAETCSICEEDCPCPGVTLLDGVLSPDTPWEVTSSAAIPEAVRYLGSDPPTLTVGGDSTTWSALELEQPIVGDFGLSFDVLVEEGTGFWYQPSQTYVGLGTSPDLDESTGEAAPAAGAFALVASCSMHFYPTPVGMLGGTAFGDPNHLANPGYTGECFGTRAQRLGQWHHVELIRAGNTLTTRVVGHAWQNETEGLDACNLEESSTEYSGALPALTHLLVGTGGGSFQSSLPFSDPVTIANLVLRLPDDPDECPESRERCDDGKDQPSCVDVSSSNEHCGGCGQACERVEACEDGECICTALVCDGTCVDSQTSSQHCGACDSPCDGPCMAGACASCGSAFELPGDGGTVSLTLSAAPFFGFDWCGATSMGELIGTWTPSRSGTATLSVVSIAGEPATAYVDPVVAVTADTTCSTWLACNDDEVAYEYTDPILTGPVIAGTPYRIGVGVWDYSRAGVAEEELLQTANVELSVQVE